jgi:hypothetical protein
MDMHRQKLKPSYIAARQKRAVRGHGNAGMKSNNPNGRPPSLTGLEDRTYFIINPKDTIVGGPTGKNVGSSPDEGKHHLLARYEFNRFMRQVIQRAFNNAIIAVGGQVVAQGKLDNRDFSRLFGPTFTIDTKFGKAFVQIVIEKHRLFVRFRHDLEGMKMVNTKAGRRNFKEMPDLFVADPVATPYPLFWPAMRVTNGDVRSELAQSWDGDVSRMVEPEAVWSKDKTGSAAFMYERFVKFLGWVTVGRQAAIDALPKLPWRF